MTKTLTKPTVSESFEDMLSKSLTPKVAISYLRVSTHDQAERGGGADEGFSIPAQREANKKKAASIGAFVIKEFVDRGASARSADRPELQRMLEYIEENKSQIDYVIVHKIDRLARNRGDDVDITRALQRANVKLVSTTESIDETPSGILLHGIMSSIAEFYSRNLSNEVTKGLGEKARNGGTVYQAPLGYKNIRIVDEKGREDRTVVLDEERAPLIRLAFEYYATGDWTLRTLSDHLMKRGLTTRATPKVPSKPMDLKSLGKLLVNPYYKGVVSFQGVFYPGNHTPLTDDKTWDQVQSVLTSHVVGERTREYPHFLKSTIYCAKCGSRLCIQMAKSKSGTVYPYFVCSGRHSKRQKCLMKAVLIDEVEYKIEQLYEKISLQPELRESLEIWMNKKLDAESGKFESDRLRLRKDREKLERQRAKLLEAHYADAITLELFKSEQDRINKAILDIDDQLSYHDENHESLRNNLKNAFDLIENCGQAYKQAPDSIKRAFNQALFEKILVDSNGDVTPELAPPFDILVGHGGIAAVFRNLATAASSEGISKQRKNPVQNNFFEQGSYMDFLVENRGICICCCSCRPSPAHSAGSDHSLLESPQDFLPTGAPLRVRSPTAYKKILEPRRTLIFLVENRGIEPLTS